MVGLIRCASSDIGTYVPDIPPVGATIAFMIFESILFMGTAFYIDMHSISQVIPTATVEAVLELDADVEAERLRTETQLVDSVPLKVDRLRKVFPPKQAGRPAVIANENVSFCVEKGEIFGLLGANGT